MLIDTAHVVMNGGHGGAGVVSFGAKEKSGPDGGNGGKGGSLYLRAVSDITLLNQFSMQTSFTAGDGHPGRKKRQTGKDGTDLELLIPRGTSVFDDESGTLLVELNDLGEKVRICVGGKGGRGNYEFRSSKRTTPEYAQPGLRGETKRLKLVLKLIADFGLIGLPNAGKSSLLNELTNAKAKVANYAFTTLSPNLGVLEGKVLADIPGLIEGASDGKGLGVSFLKHIEKVGVLLHCISSESQDPLQDYKTIRQEMGNYNKELLTKKEILLITKSDLVDKSVITKLTKQFAKKGGVVIAVSIHDWESLQKLKQLISQNLGYQ